jgi:hypothetical protein
MSQDLLQLDMDQQMPDPETVRQTKWRDGPAFESCGYTWQLPDPGLAAVLKPYRDEFYDLAVRTGMVPCTKVQAVAVILLTGNFCLNEIQAAVIVLSADQTELATAVSLAMFGGEGGYRYTEWAESAFYANGLDPAKVPPHLVNQVLRQLVKTGRAVPPDEWIDSQIASNKFQSLMNQAGA